MRTVLERPALLAALGAILAVCAFQLWISPSNPPGFHRDEAALSLNAYTLSQGLRDEDGARFPLFFRSFDDYKSPLYPYLLAAVFRVTGPGPEVARGLSAVLVLAAVLLLGVLARRLTGSTLVAVVTVALAGLTPWLFELGRMAIEATTEPVIVVGLLLWLHRVVGRAAYSIPDGVVAGLLVGLLTYSYTGSRLLGPLFAAALAVFAGGGRWRFLAAGWTAFLVSLVPMGVFALRHPGALTARYEATSIARDGVSGLEVPIQAVGNWFRDFDPVRWAFSGDPAPYIHNGGYGSVFVSVTLLAAAGVVIVLRRECANRWWWFVLVATLLVPVPAALTVDRYNAIRLAALPVFLLTLSIPALDGLLSWARGSWVARGIAGLLLVTVAVQFSQFLHEYRTRGPARLVLFEAGAQPLLRDAFATGEELYTDFDDRGAQAEARWYAAQAGLPQSRVVILPDGGIPPPGSLVFLRFQDCDFPCAQVARWEDYRVMRSAG